MSVHPLDAVVAASDNAHQWHILWQEDYNLGSDMWHRIPHPEANHRTLCGVYFWERKRWRATTEPNLSKQCPRCERLFAMGKADQL